MTRLWMVRHGESEWNLRELVQGQSPAAGSLTPRGIAQADACGLHLASLVTSATAVVTSDLARARDTAAIVAGILHLPVRVDTGLREQSLGVLEGLPLAGSFEDVPVANRIARLWQFPEERPAGGESILALQARVAGTLRRLASAAPGELVVVSHGGPVRVLLALDRPELLALGRELVVGNGSLTRVEVDAEGRIEVFPESSAGFASPVP